MLPELFGDDSFVFFLCFIILSFGIILRSLIISIAGDTLQRELSFNVFYFKKKQTDKKICQVITLICAAKANKET